LKGKSEKLKGKSEDKSAFIEFGSRPESKAVCGLNQKLSAARTFTFCLFPFTLIMMLYSNLATVSLEPSL
jgi:hypothetical protein